MKSTQPILTPLKAIRAKCLDCCGNLTKEVQLCVCPDCSLYPYRMGKNPNRKRTFSEEQRKTISQQLAAGRKHSPK